MLNKLQENKREVLLLAVLLLISGVVHGYNMLHFPYFENDEGTYFAQAWSFLAQGKLSPYTYWYDHAPLGWIFTSIWIFLTGGLFSFGFSLYSARVFMLIIHLFSTFLLFKITRKITESSFAAFIAVIFFAVSPLAIYFQRRLLLDNIMTFWMLLSLYLILFSKKRLRYFVVSALAFGIAVLTKENAIFSFPVYAWLVFKEAHQHNKLFAVVKWVVIAGMIISLYPLYAILKGELFPVGSIFSSSHPHVSLLGTLKDQASRGTGLPFWADKSNFTTSFHYWLSHDQLFVLLGFLSFIAQGIYSLFKKSSRVVFLLTLSIFAFFISGKLVINFYVIPLLPFLAMCIGLTLAQQVKQIRQISKASSYTVTLIILLFIGYFYYKNHFLHDALTHNETTVQLQAVSWIKKNINPKQFIAIDYYGNLDLSESRFPGDPKFKNTDWYWKAEYDLDIRSSKLKNNFHNINYILLTAQMYIDLNSFPGNTSIVKKALDNSTRIKMFAVDNSIGKLNLAQYYQSHPNGDWVMIYKQNSNKDTLASTWNTYKEIFMDQGKVTDMYAGKTTSEGQSYALLRAVWVNDKVTFDKALSWTTKNILLHDKNLFAWWYGKNNKGQMGIIDKGTATDADQDIAVALLFASKQWHDPIYQMLAQKIISDIWKYETAEVTGKRYVVAGNWTSQPDKKVYTINPSYLAPYAYRMFAEVDKEHNWMSLVDSSYDILDKCSASPLGLKKATYLPPNWCNVKRNGEIVAADNIGKDSTDYSFDALRVVWRIALDYQWYKDQRALTYLDKINLFTQEWKKSGKIHTTYTHDGKTTDDSESPAQYGTQLAYFTLVDKTIADKMYNSKILSYYNHDKNQFYWGDKNNYYNQNWAWFGTALYLNSLPNLWRE